MAHFGPPGVSPVLWCNHGALIMTAASVKKSARVTFEPKGFKVLRLKAYGSRFRFLFL